MKLDDIKTLMQEFDASGIYKFSLEMDSVKLVLQKEPLQPAAAPVAVPQVFEQAAPGVLAAPAEETQAASDVTPVKSPVVGTFYSASAPGAKPFVKVGQHVEQGQTLCIVEAMKMMNEITAPISGTVEKILVKEEEMVEFDQVIMLIKE